MQANELIKHAENLEAEHKTELMNESLKVIQIAATILGLWSHYVMCPYISIYRYIGIYIIFNFLMGCIINFNINSFPACK